MLDWYFSFLNDRNLFFGNYKHMQLISIVFALT